MSIPNLYKTLNHQSKLDARCGIAAGQSITEAREQIRVDLHSQGFSWSKIQKGRWENGGFEVANSYENALQLFQQKILKQKLIQNGQVLIGNLWPHPVQIQPIHQQIAQKYNHLSELDLCAQIAPSQLNLTAGFLYRTVEKKADRSHLKNGDLIGIPQAGLELIQGSLPPVSKFGRFWGALSVLQVITDKFSLELPESILIGIIDQQRIHYFSIRKLQLSGLRSSARSSLRDSSDLHSTITSLGSETSCLLFVNLTTTTEDLEQVSLELEKNKKWTIRTMGRNELLQAFPELQAYASAPHFPLSLLSNQNISHPLSEIQNPSFVTSVEAMMPQVNSSQGKLLKISRAIRLIVLLITLSLLGFSGYQIFTQMTSPAWSVKKDQADKIKIDFDQFIQQSQEYQKNYKTLVSFPRFDHITLPLLEPAPEGILLEEIRFNSRSNPKDLQKKSFEIFVTGTMTHNDLLKIRDYAQQLELRYQKDLPLFHIEVNESGLTEKPNRSGASFRLSVKMENKNV